MQLKICSFELSWARSARIVFEPLSIYYPTGIGNWHNRLTIDRRTMAGATDSGCIVDSLPLRFSRAHGARRRQTLHQAETPVVMGLSAHLPISPQNRWVSISCLNGLEMHRWVSIAGATDLESVDATSVFGREDYSRPRVRGNRVGPHP